MTTTGGIRFRFNFATSYRLPALVFGIVPATAYVEVGPAELFARFGPWSLRTALSNVRSTEVSEGYAYLKTAGPPHLSFTDRGVTFATNGRLGLCLQFREPVKAIDPTGRIRHPGATFTVEDPQGLAKALGSG